MPSTVDLIREVAANLELELSSQPFGVLNESEFQALLHARLLDAFPEEPKLRLADGVVERRPGQTLRSRRVYREAKVSPGQSGREPDLVILQNRQQTILPKQNKAPSRFLTPYDALIETKIDATPTQILAGHPGRALASSVLTKDREKWALGEEALNVINIVYTAVPQEYVPDESTIVVRRTVSNRPARTATEEARKLSLASFENALHVLDQQFCEHPFRFLREKDFETALFSAMRHDVHVDYGEINPVRTQWRMDWKDVLGRTRRHDLVVLGPEVRTLELEVELKTSHSDQHNWFRTPALRGEFEAIHKLREHGHLERGIFLLFRFGPERWEHDADVVCQEFGEVELDYRCSERES